MRDFTSAQVFEFNKLNSKNPILLLLELEYASATHYFINNEDELVWGGHTYNPLPFSFDTIPGKRADTLPEVQLEVMNLPTLLEILDDNDGLVGCDVTLYIVYATESAGVWSIAGDYADTYPLRFTYTIKGTSVAKTSIQFKLGVPNYFQLPFPARLYRRDWCDFAYKGDLCWMGKGGANQDGSRVPVSESDSCDHSYAACKAHHLDQSSPHLGVRFGGFPNLGKGSYRY